MTAHAIRGRLLSFRDDPALVGPEAAVRYLEDGVVVLENGVIKAVGPADEVALPPGTTVERYGHELILPGLIDAHIHYPQTRVIASYGAQLLEWLQKYTFVEEQKLKDLGHATALAEFFLDELLRNGTTTAAVYCTVHPESVEAFFAASHRRNTRMIAGKMMMDQGAPTGLLDTPERGYRESKALLERWHGRGRQLYAVSPRFALTSSAEQLANAGALLREHPGVWLQTHLSENLEEVATACRLHPEARSYADIYDRHGLLGERSLFGHCIHLSEPELARLSATSSVAVFCPTSNLFIGSGLLDLARLRDPARPVRVALATDVGGGTSYSMLATAAEAYKVLQLQGQNLSPWQAFYLMTLGNARALSLDDRIGAIEPGREADLVVLDAAATPAMAHRMVSVAGDLAEELFVLMILGDDRAVRATYIAGKRTTPPV